MPSRSGRLAAAIGGILAASFLCIAGSGVVRAEDRLLGMVEPVKAKKPYRIAYSSADMNADFFLALAGCTTTVLLSWIKLLRDAFSKDDDEGPAPDETRTQRRPGTRSEL